ncbi:MAG: hypothetical protein K6A80_05375 [Saccharofermentans sp.]|nr:hypothetical protein [Saccharofermentans sp.]
MSDNKSLYSIISSSLVNGELPVDFSLPAIQNGKEPKWADGAQDGVLVSHWGRNDSISDEDQDLMQRAVAAASEGNFDLADELFGELGKHVRAINIYSKLQKYVVLNIRSLDEEMIFRYAARAISESADRETVKFGLCLLQLNDEDNDPDVKDVIRTLALCDEFTLFVIFMIRDWPEGNDEVFRLAQKVHGWGRIHAVIWLDADSEEIKRWLLLEGVHNSIMYAYSAGECWAKSDAISVLRKGPTREEFTGIRDIIDGLCDEGPCKGLSEIEGKEEIILLFLKAARDFDLDYRDYMVINFIKDFFEDEEHPNPDIVFICNRMLSSDECRAAVKEGVLAGHFISFAPALGINYQDEILNKMRDSFLENYSIGKYLIHNPEYRDAAVDLYREKLPLEDLKNAEWRSPDRMACETALSYVVGELYNYPYVGLDLIETALQTDSMWAKVNALNVLGIWANKEGKPLSEILPETNALILKLSETELVDAVKKKMIGTVRINSDQS